ncbi:MAG: filamentous hemagglutinin N-terminal domain-containing protein [Xenococcus sp. (in: cyanobacteria)]
MRQGLLLLISLGFSTFSQGIFLISATAQVTPDGTTNTTVDVSGEDFTINQGDRAGDNLFHSFGEFSVPTDGSAFFNNAVDIVNIFSPVTGGNISNIDGLLGANGTANLFLINPAGIIFGEGARLDIGGSFYGSSADSIVFSNGEFSATDLANPPLITINAPIGLNFRDNPGEILNRSDFAKKNDFDGSINNRIGLEVDTGNSIALIGGNVSVIDSGITAPGGRVTLGGLSQPGIITINEDGSFIFLEDIGKADVFLLADESEALSTFGGSKTKINVVSDNRGDIAVTANNLVLDQASLEFGSQVLSDAEAGEINITASSILLNNSDIGSPLLEELNIGDINLTANSISLNDSSFVGHNILAFLKKKTITIGDINLTADSIFVNDSSIASANFNLDGGLKVGDINLTADSISFNNSSINIIGLASSEEGEIGEIGDTNLIADSIFFDNSFIGSDNSRRIAFLEGGTVGDINLEATSISLNNFSSIGYVLSGNGTNTGDINLTADNIFIK